MHNLRDSALDLMRGLAIIMMIAFHFIYDLNSFGFTEVPLFTPVAYTHLTLPTTPYV